MINKVKTVFIGSGVFAVEILQGLLGSPSVELLAVVTQPDRPTGRKKILTPCPVGQFVSSKIQSNLKVYKPEKLKAEAEVIINETKPDLIIVADYGQIIPDIIINYPKHKCLNVHGSLLPDLRGAVPIPMAILKGYTETGVSIPIMTPRMDDGDIVASAKMPIAPDDTTESLKAKLAKLGADLLVSILPDWIGGKITPIKQDESKATMCWQKDIAKEKAQIKPNMTAQDVDRMVRAFYPWPIAWGNVNDSGKIYRVKIIRAKYNNRIDEFRGKGVIWEFINGSITLLEAQKEGSNITNDCGFLKNVEII